jgi:hypothetical protein
MKIRLRGFMLDLLLKRNNLRSYKLALRTYFLIPKFRLYLVNSGFSIDELVEIGERLVTLSQIPFWSIH